MATRAIASESDRGVGAAVNRDRQRQTGRQQGWRAVCRHEGQGCRGDMEADRDRLADSRAGELCAVMRDRGVGAIWRQTETDWQTAGLESCVWS